MVAVKSIERGSRTVLWLRCLTRTDIHTHSHVLLLPAVRGKKRAYKVGLRVRGGGVDEAGLFVLNRRIVG